MYSYKKSYSGMLFQIRRSPTTLELNYELRYFIVKKIYIWKLTIFVALTFPLAAINISATFLCPPEEA